MDDNLEINKTYSNSSVNGGCPLPIHHKAAPFVKGVEATINEVSENRLGDDQWVFGHVFRVKCRYGIINYLCIGSIHERSLLILEGDGSIRGPLHFSNSVTIDHTIVREWPSIEEYYKEILLKKKVHKKD